VQAMLPIGRYLYATKDKCLIYKPQAQSFDLWCAADFSGNWAAELVHNDSSTAKSCTGYHHILRLSYSLDIKVANQGGFEYYRGGVNHLK